MPGLARIKPGRMRKTRPMFYTSLSDDSGNFHQHCIVNIITLCLSVILSVNIIINTVIIIFRHHIIYVLPTL